ncbi:MAG: hypothetical protein U1F66_13160 [bacterium]
MTPPLGTASAWSRLSRLPLQDSASRELADLAKEADPTLRDEGLLNLATREERAGNLGAALELYSAVSTPALLGRAQRRIEALLGRGSLAERSEIFFRNLAREASNPAALISMGVASTVFRMTRLTALAGLSCHATGNLFTRGLGARLVAGLAGFALEAPAFTLSSRALRGAPEAGAAEPSLGAELASSYLLLGALKLGGALGTGMARRLGAHQPFASGLLRQGALLGGIALGRRLEGLAELRPIREGESLLVDSLATLLHLHVAGRLAQSAFGPRFSAWERGLEARGELLLHRPPPGGIASAGLLEPAWASSRGRAGDPKAPFLMAMSSDDSNPPSSDAPTLRPTLRLPAVEAELRATDLYMILLNLPRALRMPEPRLSYDGDSWVEARDAAAIAGRLRAAIPLPREATVELRLLRQGQRVLFFWEGDRVQYRIIPEAGSAQSPTKPATVNSADTLPSLKAAQPAPPPAPEGGYRIHFGKGATPEPTDSNRITASDAAPPLSYRDWKSYEQEMDRRIEAFYREMVAEAPSVKSLEEACALRGRRLARIANVAFKAETSEDTRPTFHPIEVAVRIQQLLQHAYGHFDFGTLQSFRERITTLGEETLESSIELRNFALRRKGRPLLLRAGEMPLDLPGAYLIPREAGWRDGFLAEWIKAAPHEELPRRVPELLQDPAALARLSAPMIRRRLNGFVSQTLLLQGMLPKEKLSDLLNPERTYRSDSAAELHAQALGLLREAPELARLLVGGRGAFHREYLRTLFFSGAEPVAEPYQEFLKVWQELPAAQRDLGEGRLFLPSLSQVRDFSRASSRPAPR